MTCVSTAKDPFLATGLEKNELRFGGERNEYRTYKPRNWFLWHRFIGYIGDGFTELLRSDKRRASIATRPKFRGDGCVGTLKCLAVLAEPMNCDVCEGSHCAKDAIIEWRVHAEVGIL
jgi:hypothetical protein